MMEGKIRFSKTLSVIPTVITLVAVYFILEKPLVILFKDTWVDVILSNIEHRVYIDILVSILFLSIVLFYIYKISQDYRFSRLHYSAIMVLSIIYLIHRIKHSAFFEFTSYNSLQNIKYLDWLLLILGLSLLSYIKALLSKPTKLKNESVLVVDEPISKIAHDKLSRKSLVEFVSGQVVGLNVEKSYSIGINGKWGDGKTSLLKMIWERLDDSTDALLIEYNPWLSSNPGNIIEDYFLHLQKEIARYTSELGYTLSEYASKLKAADSGKFIESINELTNRRSSTYQKYQYVRDILKLIKRKLIVFIDDLDRLEKKEVVEVIKLIRNSGGFYNTVFIVAYDRDYIDEAVKEISEHNYHEYVDKIFQTEIQLPPIRIGFIAQLITSKISSMFPKHEKEVIEGMYLLQNLQYKGIGPMLTVDDKPPSYTNYIEKYIRNYRDAVRYINSISMHYHPIQGEISLVELMILHLLRLKFKEVYNCLYDKSIIDEKDSKDGLRIMIRDGAIGKRFQDGLKIDAEDAKELLSMLFSDAKVFPRSIVYPISYDLYFDAQIYGTISMIELSKVRSLSLSEIIEKFDLWIKDGLGEELVRIVKGISTFKDGEDLEKYIFSLFHLMDCDITMVFDRLIEILDTKKNTETFARFYDEEATQALKDKIADSISKLKDTSSTQQFIHQVHQNYNYIDGYELLIDYNTFKESCVKRLREYLASIEFIEYGSIQYLYRCIDSIDEQNLITLIPEAIKIYREKINANKSEYLKFVIFPGFIPHDGRTYALEGFIPQIFDSYESFGEFLESEDISEDISEVVSQFFDLYKKNGYKMVYIKDEDLVAKLEEIRNDKQKGQE